MLAFVAGCSTVWLAALVYRVFSSATASFAPVRIKLTDGSLTNDTLAPAGLSVERAPISSERKPKPNARSNSPREPKNDAWGLPPWKLSGHPRHRPRARVMSHGPRAA